MDKTGDSMPMCRWLTTKQAGAHISTSASFIRKAILNGNLRATNIGLGSERAEWRILAVDLDAFMEINSTATHA